MRIFPKRKVEFFSTEEKACIVESIRAAESRTSGEIRVFVETRCRYVDAMDRASELFDLLEMEKTEQRNATLIYVAVKDRQAALFADRGIYEAVGHPYWAGEVAAMLIHFKKKALGDGICHVVNDIGEALHQHFPYVRSTDKNELPDDIVFGQ